MSAILEINNDGAIRTRRKTLVNDGYLFNWSFRNKSTGAIVDVTTWVFQFFVTDASGATVLSIGNTGWVRNAINKIEKNYNTLPLPVGTYTGRLKATIDGITKTLELTKIIITDDF